ncbi:hypothetical protein E2C01_061817 [Portunus trituberculatus]|uniref:Uncharacterized protein n=1 Tax=Portunus trituberculatus TaxID=210409 RepID=A0A5B7H4W7_PORTR|nr:hypothetical protein [Portunus trituberculatus]
MAQAVSSMQQALQSASRETTMVLSNILTFRRQAVLKTLPSSFSVSDKRSLLQSLVDFPLLFKEEKVMQAKRHSETQATKSFQEAAAATFRKRPQPPASSLSVHPANRPSTSGYRPSQRQPALFSKPSRPVSSLAQRGCHTAGPRKSGF